MEKLFKHLNWHDFSIDEVCLYQYSINIRSIEQSSRNIVTTKAPESASSKVQAFLLLPFCANSTQQYKLKANRPKLQSAKTKQTQFC